MEGRVRLVHEAMHGAEKSIPEMADLLDIREEHAFDIAVAVNKELEEIGLQCHPPITKGEYDEKRVVTLDNEITEQKALEEIRQDEGFKLEYKSTFLYDIRQAEARGQCDPRDLNPENVVTSSLKSICGFLNGQGGILFIGVQDDKTIYGLEDDLKVLGEESTYDDWELKLRDYIHNRFLSGKDIQNYIKVNRVEIEGKVVARIAVSRRGRESFLKVNGDPKFFIRTGNRTDNISIEDLPDVVRKRDADDTQ